MLATSDGTYVTTTCATKGTLWVWVSVGQRDEGAHSVKPF